MSEASERRQTERLVSIVEVDIGERRFAASNVSESGFALIGNDPSWSEGMNTEARICFVTPDGQSVIMCHAELVRREGGLCGFRYADITEFNMDRLRTMLDAQAALSED